MYLIGQHGIPGQKANGVIITGDEFGNEVQQDTLQCCHCGKHWVFQKGSGKDRSWCPKCNRVLCGNPKCEEHKVLYMDI